MDNSCRKTDTLVSLCTDYVVKALPEYVDGHSLNHLPPHLKNCILKKFLASSFYWCKINFNHALANLVAPSMQRIDLTLANVNDEVLYILKDCNQLREAYLTRVKNCELTSQGLIQFLQPLKHLSMLQLSNCSAVDDDVLVAIVKSCPRLNGLDVGGCWEITSDSVKKMAIMEHLHWLNFSGTQVCNKGIEKLITGSSNIKIKELRLSNCVNVNASILHTVLELCPNIEVLVFYKSELKDSPRTGTDACVPFEKGALKNLKQLAWTVQW